jgi:DNA-binding transcriptional regulator YiaG
MNPPANKTNGAALPTPSETTRHIEQQIAELNERLTAEREHDTMRALLRQFVAERPALTRRDLLIVAAELRPKRDAKPVKTRKATGYTESKVEAKGKIGKAIRAGRKAKNLSSSGLARLMGIGDSTPSNWEAGRTFPSKEKAARLAKLFGQPETAFLR